MVNIQRIFLALCCIYLHLGSSMKYDCCLSGLSSTGETCSYSGTEYKNETYYCVSVDEICPSCKLSSKSDLDSASCYQCCSTEIDACGISVSYVSTGTWCKFKILWTTISDCDQKIILIHLIFWFQLWYLSYSRGLAVVVQSYFYLRSIVD